MDGADHSEDQGIVTHPDGLERLWSNATQVVRLV